MAYSDFEKPRYNNSKQAQFYPEEYDYIPGRTASILYNQSNYVRHSKTLNALGTKDSLYDHDKSPIYVHPLRKRMENFSTRNMCYTEILSMHGVTNNLRTQQAKKVKKTPKNVINKLEETYWSNWKPMKDDTCTKNSSVQMIKKKGTNALNATKDIVEPEKGSNKISVDDLLRKSKSAKSTVQRELSAVSITNKKILEIPEIDKKDDVIKIKEEEPIEPDDSPIDPDDSPIDIHTMGIVNKIQPVQSVTIKHTDSLVILKKKKAEAKENVEQPKCIKLFKKLNKAAISVNRSYVRGGSYPLKSANKSENPFGFKPMANYIKSRKN